ncbi:MAG: hypothetical protein HQL15_11140, partial [Candidatus Omnitrophica bacterium]|nr:hypothetical protein [Candidatus Omnitrophota bacterium]
TLGGFVPVMVANLKGQSKQENLETRLNLIENFKQQYIRMLVALNSDKPEAQHKLNELAKQLAEHDSFMRHQNTDGRVLGVDEHFKEAFNRMIKSLQTAFSEKGDVFGLLNQASQDKIRSEIASLKALEAFHFEAAAAPSALINVETPEALIASIKATNPDTLPLETAGYREGALTKVENIPGHVVENGKVSDTEATIQETMALNGSQQKVVYTNKQSVPVSFKVNSRSTSITLQPSDVFVPEQFPVAVNHFGKIYAADTNFTEGYDVNSPIALMVLADNDIARAEFIGPNLVEIKSNLDVNGQTIEAVAIGRLDPDTQRMTIVRDEINTQVKELTGQVDGKDTTVALARPWVKGDQIVNLHTPTGDRLIIVLNGQDTLDIKTVLRHSVNIEDRTQSLEILAQNANNDSFTIPMVAVDENTQLLAAFGLQSSPTGEIQLVVRGFKLSENSKAFDKPETAIETIATLMQNLDVLGESTTTAAFGTTKLDQLQKNFYEAAVAYYAPQPKAADADKDAPAVARIHTEEEKLAFATAAYKFIQAAFGQTYKRNLDWIINGEVSVDVPSAIVAKFNLQEEAKTQPSAADAVATLTMDAKGNVKKTGSFWQRNIGKYFGKGVATVTLAAVTTLGMGSFNDVNAAEESTDTKAVPALAGAGAQEKTAATTRVTDTGEVVVNIKGIFSGNYE